MTCNDVVGDWAQLKVFEADNAKPSEHNHKTLFIGDSITERWKTLHPEWFAKYHFINRGISSQTTGKILERFYPDCISLKPRKVVIMAGVNDTHDESEVPGVPAYCPLYWTKGCLSAMILLAKHYSITPVVLSILPHLYSVYPGTFPRIPEINTWLKGFCQDNNVLYIDLYKLFFDRATGVKPGLTDGFHPVLAGYLVMERAVLQYVI